MEPMYPRLKQYVREMGGDAAFASRMQRAGYACSRSLINVTCNHGTLPKRDAPAFKATVNAVLLEAGYSPSVAWRQKTNTPAASGPAKKRSGRRATRSVDKRRSTTEHQRHGESNMSNKTKETLGPEHLRHFGLKADPFFPLLDHRSIWMPERLQRIQHLIEMTALHQGMLVLTGDYGAGKSTLLRHVLRSMVADRRYHVIMPDRLDRKAMRGDMLAVSILDHMCAPGTRIPRSAGQRDKLARNLLTRAIQRGESPVLVIDEAHDLSEEIFIALKRLWDSGLIFRNLAIVLAGAGGVDRFGKPWGLRWEIEGNTTLKEFAERTQLVDLGRLAEGMPEYLAWRFQSVDASVGTVFEAQAIEILAERGETPLLTDNLAIRAIREAYLDGALKVGAEHALRA